MTELIKSILKIPGNLSLEDIHNLKKENKNLIEKESEIRTKFYRMNTFLISLPKALV